MRRTLLAALALSVLALVLPTPVSYARASCEARPGELAGARTPELVVVRALAANRRPRQTICIVATGERRPLFSRARVRRAAGPYVIYEHPVGRGARLDLLDAATDEITPLEFAEGRRFTRVSLDARGRAAWLTKTSGDARAPKLSVLEPYRSPRLISSARTIERLRLRAGRLTWRARGRLERRHLGDATCAPRRGADLLVRTSTVMISVRSTRTGNGPDSRVDTDYWGCLRADGRQRRIGSSARYHNGFSGFSSISAIRVSTTHVAFVVDSYNRYHASVGIVVRDLRSGSIAGTLAPFDGGQTPGRRLGLLAVDDAGRVLALIRTEGRETLQALAADDRLQVLDEGQEGAITDASILSGGLATWRRQGEARSQRLN